ncbi:autophagy-related protein 27 [Staphylotrichum tortipilum]|uniref:Autophagy-related protein 27 n=1 Tax=Staphylotrichum tortipilum TaxID=2831512 RepID=A0AAN6MT53_9PEZI|nr:autophagy-related protein 27 [Staphylotrichum longicolle]
MRPPSTWCSPLEAAALLLLLAPAATLTTAAATTSGTTTPPTQLLAAPSELTCDNIVVVATDGAGGGGGKSGAGQHKYNLQALGGPHTVVTSEYTAPTWHNTTYTIDVCGALKRKGDVPVAERCPDGTRVCAIKHRWDPKTGKTTDTDQVIPVVVGDDKAALAWEAARLPADSDKAQKDGSGKKEGLRLTLHGATTYQQREQRTVVEFRCNPDREGTEGEWESVDEYERPKKTKREEGGKKDDPKKDDGDKKDGDKKEGDKKDDESTPEKQLKKDGAALVWEGYKREKGTDGADMDTLYLTWYTKHACDAAVDEPPPAKESQSWGIFTWLVILAFLAIASYLIFGSWLNYNRYGARGWDLLPHGDMLRDVPYLMKDLVRRILNTLQSTGSRGGYSAV